MQVNDLSDRAGEAESFLKALANKHRLMILCELHKGERSVGQLLDSVDLSQSALSQHLARLRDDGLVSTRRASQMIYYSLASADTERFIALLYGMYCAPDCLKPKGKTDVD
jgi:DNA-binding transcriptional ArsR family regulator